MKRISLPLSRRPAVPGAAFAVCCALVAGLGSGAQAANRKMVSAVPSGPPPWPGSRVVMVLPLKLGEGWNADRATGQALLQPAEERLVDALEATGKLSPVQPHRFSPLLQRANRDGALSEDGALSADEFRALVDNPTLENARTLIGKLTFDQPAMIADCTLEEIRVSGTAQRPALQMQVSGRLYQGTDATAFRTIVVTSDAESGGRSNFDRALLAGSNAFGQVAAAFVAPLEDIALSFPATTPGSGGTSATKPATGTTGTTDSGTSTAAPPVASPPLPEDSARGGLPEFPQGKLPLTPGAADPNRFEGTPPAEAAPANPAPAPAPADTPPADVEPAPADVAPAPAKPAPPADVAPPTAPAEPAPAEPVPVPADAAPADAAPAEPAPADAAPADGNAAPADAVPGDAVPGDAMPDDAVPAAPDDAPPVPDEAG